ncbi:MAG: DUF4493 domain-containing protein [Alistipes sp.]|nr:DUF4493 domain-containing protein [Alistipes sp.]
MKRRFPQYLGLLLCGLLSLSCVEETSRFEGGEAKPDKSNIGYLTFDQLEMTVVDRTEEIDHHPESYALTRAGNTDVESYTVEILDAKGQPVEVTDKNGTTGSSFLYGNRPELIELPAGVYTLSVYSDTTPDAAFDTPTYGAAQTVTITRGNTTALQDMTCRLLSVKVTVAYKDTLIATMSKDTQAEVVLGEKNALVFEGKEPTLVGYLKPSADQSNPLVLYLTTTFNEKKIDRQPLVVARDAKAGQYRNITVGLQNAEDGTVVISAEIETWLENDEIVVDCQKVAVTALCEERIPDENDPDAPKLEWPGHSLDEVFTLDDSKFDANKYFIGNVDLTVTAKAPIATFFVGVTSDNAAFNAYLALNGLTEPQNTATVDGPARTALRLWGFPAENLQVTERSFRLTPLMKVLFDYEGNHVFTLTITDEAGRKSTFELKIAVKHDTGDQPRIVWPDHDLGTRYETTEVEEVALLMTVPNGVRSLWVEIHGALEAGLAGMMPSQFELTDPGEIASALNGFGFPTGDAVKDQTDLTFSISADLIGMMSVFPGETDFKLVVTDNAGQTAEATIKLLVPEQ